MIGKIFVQTQKSTENGPDILTPYQVSMSAGASRATIDHSQEFPIYS